MAKGMSPLGAVGLETGTQPSLWHILARSRMAGVQGNSTAAGTAAPPPACHVPPPSGRGAVIAQGFVGQATPLAGQYHSTDYDWHEHAMQQSAALDAQWAAAPAAVREAALLDANGAPLSAVAQLLGCLKQGAGSGQQKQQQFNGCTAATGSGTSNGSTALDLHGGNHAAAVTATGSLPLAPAAAASAVARAAAAAGPSDWAADSSSIGNTAAAAAAASTSSPTSSSRSSSSSSGDSTGSSSSSSDEAAPAPNEWESFYRAHPAARFFKERRYLLLEFPCLAPPSAPEHFVEIGAGCGSSILPVLRAQPQARATVCDVSGTCLQQLLTAMQHLGLDSKRVEAFVADGTSAELGRALAGAAADVALIMFTLSAVMPQGMLVMMSNAAAALRPGGLLCIRDHALYDMVQLRIPPAQCLGRHLYLRGDGTLAYFYTTEDLSGLAVAAGLEVVECHYVCVINKNRKTGQCLRRSFVHGVFRKPLHGHLLP